MSSSGNRFAPLREPSSSREQKKRAPATGPSDQTMPAGRASEASPLSLISLQDSLPLTSEEYKKQEVALFLKRARDYETEQNEQSRKKTSRQSSNVVVHQAPSAAPAPADTMEVDEEFDCRMIINPERRPKCLFRYEDEEGKSTATIGDLWKLRDNGFSILLDVDGGRYGSAMVSLIFRINKGDKNAPLSKNSEEYHECRVTWRAGVTIDEQKVILDLKRSRVMDLAENGVHPYDQAIVGSCPRERRHQLPHLMAIVFTCAAVQTTGVNDRWFDGLSQPIVDALNELFFGIGNHKMTIWFHGWPNAETAYRNWGQPLEDAVSLGFDAFWQYQKEDGTPNYSIKDTLPIKSFQKGMYVKYRPQRHPNGTPTAM